MEVIFRSPWETQNMLMRPLYLFICFFISSISDKYNSKSRVLYCFKKLVPHVTFGHAPTANLCFRILISTAAFLICLSSLPSHCQFFFFFFWKRRLLQNSLTDNYKYLRLTFHHSSTYNSTELTSGIYYYTSALAV